MHTPHAEITGTAGEEIAKYRLVKLTGDRTYKYAHAGERAIGSCTELTASGDPLTVDLLRGRLGSMELMANGAITQNALVYVAANGKVSSSGIGKPVGVALAATTADGDVVDVLPLDDLADAGPAGQFEVFDDFTSYIPESGGSEALWDEVLTDSGTITLGDTRGGMLVIAASDGSIGNNDEAYLHTANELFLIEASKPLYFETRIKLAAADSDGANVMVGVISGSAADHIQDTGGGPPASYDGVVVYKVDGGSAWAAEISVGGTQTAITLTSPGAPGTSYQKIGILVVPTSSTAATAYIFVDGTLVGSQSFTFTGMTEMDVFLGVKNGGTAVNTTLHVDYVLCRQAR